jgi:hypothetical protein
LAALGLLRLAVLGVSDCVAAHVTDRDRSAFRRKVRLHMLWFVFPSIIIHGVRPFRSGAMYVYHLAVCCISLLFRVLVVFLPVFLVSHVYLWERGLGATWPSFPSRVADVLSVMTIVSGATIFFARVYSPVLREVEPPWTFFKPLLLLVPFITGMLARHPTWSPMSYHATVLLHALSAAGVLALIPFARLLSNMHAPLTDFVPQAAWRTSTEGEPGAGVAVVRR